MQPDRSQQRTLKFCGFEPCPENYGIWRKPDDRVGHVYWPWRAALKWCEEQEAKMVAAKPPEPEPDKSAGFVSESKHS